MCLKTNEYVNVMRTLGPVRERLGGEVLEYPGWAKAIDLSLNILRRLISKGKHYRNLRCKVSRFLSRERKLIL